MIVSPDLAAIRSSRLAAFDVWVGKELGLPKKRDRRPRIGPAPRGTRRVVRLVDSRTLLLPLRPSILRVAACILAA